MILVREIKIPMLRDVKLSEARMKKYFIQEDKVLKLPIKYQDKTKYDFVPVKRGRRQVMMLCKLATMEKVIANPIAQGTPKWIRVNFQLIWNNQVSEHTRNKIALELKESYKDELAKIEPITTGFPLKTHFIIHSKDEQQDIDNLTILYIKTFHDTLVDTGIIPDDTLAYLKRYEAQHEDSSNPVDYIEVKMYSLAGRQVRITRRSLALTA